MIIGKMSCYSSVVVKPCGSYWYRGGSRGRVKEVRTPPPRPEMTCGFLIQLVFCKKKRTMWFNGVELEQETSALPPKKNPGSAPGITTPVNFMILYEGILIRYLEEAQRICRIVKAQEMSDKAVDKNKKRRLSGQSSSFSARFDYRESLNANCKTSAQREYS